MTEHTDPQEQRTTRRGSLAKAGGLLATAVAAGGLKSVLADGAAAATDGVGPAGVATGAVTCLLTPELTEGPYYVANEQVRRNITEGRPGTQLTLRLAVVDASSCKAIKGAAVDVWHCDALGVYSGVQNQLGKTFMRGIQKTDAKGIAVFQTLYPGWYTGRAVHIHVKVHIGGNVVHTGQLFFPDTTTDAAYKAAPYNTRGARNTRNAADSIFVNGGSKSLLGVRHSGAAYAATITMGVHRS
jgi:protocatechuate 3,4-dioxygenase beta subunit